jgi:chemotaxis methyl-accepting protein methylase
MMDTTLMSLRVTVYDGLFEALTEILALGRDLLIHVTEFFRDPETFDELVRSVFPA